MAGFGDEILLWRGPSGTTDLSGNGNNATYRNGATTVVDTDMGGSVAFSLTTAGALASTDWIEGPSLAAWNGATKASLGLWMWRSNNSTLVIVGQVPDQHRFGVTWASSPQSIFVHAENGGFNFPSVANTTFGWHLFGLIFDASASPKLRFYFDGVLQSISGDTAISTLSTTASRPFSLGRYNSLTTVGRFDDIRCWDYAIDPARFAEWYAVGRGYDAGAAVTYRRQMSAFSKNSRSMGAF